MNPLFLLKKARIFRAAGPKTIRRPPPLSLRWLSSAEDYGLSAAPVFVINLRIVFGRDRGHGMPSFALVGIGRLNLILLLIRKILMKAIG